MMEINMKRVWQFASLLTVVLMLMGYAQAKEDWGYTGETGPSRWASLSKDYAICKKGLAQSPINIESSQLVTASDRVMLHYHQEDLLIIDTGHSVQFKPKNTTDTLVYNDHEYALQQIHFHNQSENTIDGKHYPLEAHFVHQDNSGHLLVLAKMFEVGDRNEIIADAFERENLKRTISFNPEDLAGNVEYDYEYTGSLTTPPCSEHVQWIVVKKPGTVSEEQLDSFKEQYINNYRPIQNLNNRRILSI